VHGCQNFVRIVKRQLVVRRYIWLSALKRTAVVLELGSVETVGIISGWILVIFREGTMGGGWELLTAILSHRSEREN
jgi:hypothetical protein